MKKEHLLLRMPVVIVLFFLLLHACSGHASRDNYPWNEHGSLCTVPASGILQYEDGTPFLWLGCTAWGMTEWMTREEVNRYLDDRKAKGMNVVQLCLFWGKRRDYPTRFTVNPGNAYGFSAFKETGGMPDPAQPAITAGDTPEDPNDYWDHVDYCLEAARKRGMYAAVLPFWGRRYVNAVMKGNSMKVFTPDNIFRYGTFLGKRYGNKPNIIWVNGGDVQADAGGDFRPYYRELAEGLAFGVTGKKIRWDQEDNAWDQLLITYHPDGSPMLNSSTWFQDDPWLDFNMIETHVSRDKVIASIRQDLQKVPLKPTVLGEGHYEGIGYGDTVHALQVRRQAYETFFAGGAGFTYGGSFDKEGNGPLFSGSNHWEKLLDWEGAAQMVYVRNFLEQHRWWKWMQAPGIIAHGRGEGELEKLAVKNGNEIFIYFPENSSCMLADSIHFKTANWYNPADGTVLPGRVPEDRTFRPPDNLEDGVLLLRSGR